MWPSWWRDQVSRVGVPATLFLTVSFELASFGCGDYYTWILSPQKVVLSTTEWNELKTDRQKERGGQAHPGELKAIGPSQTHFV
jgi:hypothetical protein